MPVAVINRVTLSPPRFSLGRTCGTPGALAALREAGVVPFDLLYRHQTGDWGDVCKSDAAANERALRHDERVLSAYTLPDAEQTKVWVITEHDRSVTTILLPSEY